MVKVLADIAGGDATVPITTDRTIISHGWVQLTVNGGDCRVGDSNTTSIRGIPITDGNSTFFPPIVPPYNSYVLADIYAYLPTGAKLTVSYL